MDNGEMSSVKNYKLVGLAKSHAGVILRTPAATNHARSVTVEVETVT